MKPPCREPLPYVRPIERSGVPATMRNQMVGAMKGMKVLCRAARLALRGLGACVCRLRPLRRRKARPSRACSAASASSRRKRRRSSTTSVLRSFCRPRWICAPPARRRRRRGPQRRMAEGSGRRAAPQGRRRGRRRPTRAPSITRTSEGEPLSIDEMRAGRNPNNRVTTPGPVGGQAENNTRMTPDELRSFSTDKKPKLHGDGLERRYLSDPPGGLLRRQWRPPARGHARSGAGWAIPTARQPSSASSRKG